MPQNSPISKQDSLDMMEAMQRRMNGGQPSAAASQGAASQEQQAQPVAQNQPQGQQQPQGQPMQQGQGQSFRDIQPDPNNPVTGAEEVMGNDALTFDEDKVSRVHTNSWIDGLVDDPVVPVAPEQIMQGISDMSDEALGHYAELFTNPGNSNDFVSTLAELGPSGFAQYKNQIYSEMYNRESEKWQAEGLTDANAIFAKKSEGYIRNKVKKGPDMTSESGLRNPHSAIDKFKKESGLKGAASQFHTPEYVTQEEQNQRVFGSAIPDNEIGSLLINEALLPEEKQGDKSDRNLYMSTEVGRARASIRSYLENSTTGPLHQFLPEHIQLESDKYATAVGYSTGALDFSDDDVPFNINESHIQTLFKEEFNKLATKKEQAEYEVVLEDALSRETKDQLSGRLSEKDVSEMSYKAKAVYENNESLKRVADEIKSLTITDGVPINGVDQDAIKVLQNQYDSLFESGQVLKDELTLVDKDRQYLYNPLTGEHVDKVVDGGDANLTAEVNAKTEELRTYEGSIQDLYIESALKENAHRKSGSEMLEVVVSTGAGSGTSVMKTLLAEGYKTTGSGVGTVNFKIPLNVAARNDVRYGLEGAGDRRAEQFYEESVDLATDRLAARDMYLLNLDPGKYKKSFWARLGESATRDLIGKANSDGIFGRSDVAVVGSAMRQLEKHNIKLTDEQKENATVEFNEQVAEGVGGMSSFILELAFLNKASAALRTVSGFNKIVSIWKNGTKASKVVGVGGEVIAVEAVQATRLTKTYAIAAEAMLEEGLMLTAGTDLGTGTGFNLTGVALRRLGIDKFPLRFKGEFARLNKVSSTVWSHSIKGVSGSEIAMVLEGGIADMMGSTTFKNHMHENYPDLSTVAQRMMVNAAVFSIIGGGDLVGKGQGGFRIRQMETASAELKAKGYMEEAKVMDDYLNHYWSTGGGWKRDMTKSEQREWQDKVRDFGTERGDKAAEDWVKDNTEASKLAAKNKKGEKTQVRQNLSDKLQEYFPESMRSKPEILDLVKRVIVKKTYKGHTVKLLGPGDEEIDSYEAESKEEAEQVSDEINNDLSSKEEAKAEPKSESPKTEESPVEAVKTSESVESRPEGKAGEAPKTRKNAYNEDVVIDPVKDAKGDEVLALDKASRELEEKFSAEQGGQPYTESQLAEMEVADNALYKAREEFHAEHATQEQKDAVSKAGEAPKGLINKFKRRYSNDTPPHVRADEIKQNQVDYMLAERRVAIEEDAKVEAAAVANSKAEPTAEPTAEAVEVKAKDAFADMAEPTKTDKVAKQLGFDDRHHVVSSFLKQAGTDSETIKTNGVLDNAKVNNVFESLSSKDIMDLQKGSESAKSNLEKQSAPATKESAPVDKRQQELDDAIAEADAEVAALRESDGSVSKENKAAFKEAVKKRSGLFSFGEENKATISLKEKAEVGKDRTEYLSEKQVALADKVIQAIIDSGIKDGLPAQEISDQIINRHPFILTEVQAIKRYVAGLVNNTTEQGNSKQSFSAWRQGKMDSDIKQSLKEPPVAEKPALETPKKPATAAKTPAAKKPVKETSKITDVKAATAIVDKSNGKPELKGKKPEIKSSRTPAQQKVYDNMVVNLKKSRLTDEQIKVQLEKLDKHFGDGASEMRVTEGRSATPLTKEELAHREKMIEYLSDRLGVKATNDVRQLVDNFGATTVAAAVEAGVLYGENTTPEGIPHEYAHVYLRAMRMAPSHQKAFGILAKLVKGSEIEKLVEAKYPHLEGDALAEEVLAGLGGKTFTEDFKAFNEASGNWAKIKEAIKLLWGTVKKMFKGNWTGVAGDITAAKLAKGRTTQKVRNEKGKMEKKPLINKEVMETFRENPAEMRDVSMGRRKARKGTVKAIAKYGNVGGAKNFNKGESKLFFSSPGAFALKEILDMARSKGNDKDLAPYVRAAKPHTPKEWIESIDKIIKNDSETLEQRAADLDMVYETYMIELEKPENDPDEHDFLQRTVFYNKAIPSGMPAFEQTGYMAFQPSVTLRALLSSVTDYAGGIVDPMVVFNVLYTAADKAKTAKDFMAELDIVEATHPDGWVATLLKDNMAAMTGRGEGKTMGMTLKSDKQIANEGGKADPLNSLAVELKSMTMPEYSYYLTDGQTMSRQIANPDPLSASAADNKIKDLVGRNSDEAMANTDGMARFNTETSINEVLANATMIQAVAKVSNLSSLDMATASYVNWLKEFGYSYSESDVAKAIDNLYGSSNDVNGVILAKIGNKQKGKYEVDLSSEEKVEKYFAQHKKLLGEIAQVAKGTTRLAPTWTDGSGKRRSAPKFKTPADQAVNTLFRKEASGKLMIDEMLSPETPFYQNNDVVKFWKDQGGVEMSRNDEIRLVDKDGSAKRGIAFNQADPAAELAITLTNFSGNNNTYVVPYALNGDRPDRMEVVVPKYYGEAAKTKYANTAVSLAIRVNEAIKNNDYGLGELGPKELNEFINEIYPFGLTYDKAKNRFKFDGLDKGYAKDVLREDVDGILELFDTGLPQDMQDKVLSQASYGKEVSTPEAQREALTEYASMLAMNNAINQKELGDFFMGPLEQYGTSSKLHKRSKGMNSSGLNIDDGKPFMMVPLKDIKHSEKGMTSSRGGKIDLNVELTDGEILLTEYTATQFSNQSGANHPTGPNFKIHYNTQQRTGKDAGKGDWWKGASLRTKNNEDGTNPLDIGETTYMADMTKMLDKIQAMNPGHKVIGVYESSIKSSRFDVKGKGVSPTDPINPKNYHEIYMDNVIVNFNMNVKAEDQREDNDFSIQGSRLVAENAPDARSSAKFYDAQTKVLKLQKKLKDAKEGVGQELMENLIGRVIKNDAFTASAAKMDWLLKLASDPTIHKHIEDENLFGPALGNMNKMSSGSFRVQTPTVRTQTMSDHNGGLTNEGGVLGISAPPSLGPVGTKVISIRTPSESQSSLFASKVESHTPSDMNISATPPWWMLTSNADHDGDVLYNYPRPSREAMEGFVDKEVLYVKDAEVAFESAMADPEATPAFVKQAHIDLLDAQKFEASVELWDAMHEIIIHPDFVAARDKPTETESVKADIAAIGNNTKINRMGTVTGTIKNNSSLKLGTTGIGPTANFKKAASFLAENEITLITHEGAPNPINVKIDGTNHTLDRYDKRGLNVLAEHLQIALDQISNNQMQALGITREIMGEYMMLVTLGDGTKDPLWLRKVASFWNQKDPIIKRYTNEIGSAARLFGELDFVSRQNRVEILDEILDSYDKSPAKEKAAAEEKIASIKRLVYEYDNFQDINDFMKYDKGMPFEFSKLISTTESMRSMSEEADAFKMRNAKVASNRGGFTPATKGTRVSRDGTIDTVAEERKKRVTSPLKQKFVTMQSYLPILETKHFKYLQEAANQERDEIQNSTVRYSKGAIKNLRELVEDNGMERIYPTHIKLLDKIVPAALDGAMVSANHVANKGEQTSLVNNKIYLERTGQYLFDMKKQFSSLQDNATIPYEHTPKEIDQMESKLAMHKEGLLSLKPEDAVELEQMLSNARAGEFLSSGLNKNAFFAALKVNKKADGTGHSLYFDSNHVDASSKPQIEYLASQFKELPKSFQDMVMDYMAVSQGTKGIGANPLWAVFDLVRQDNRYKFAAQLAKKKDFSMDDFADGHYNHQRLKESAIFNMSNNFRRLHTDKVTLAQIPSSMISSGLIATKVGEAIATTFPLSGKEMGLQDYSANDVYSLNSPRKYISTKNELPRFYTAKIGDKERILLKVWQDPNSYRAYQPMVKATYIDITDAYNSRKGVVHPFVLESGGISSKKPTRTIDESIEQVKSDLDAAAENFTGNPNRTLGNQADLNNKVALISSDPKRYERIMKHLNDKWGHIIKVKDWEKYPAPITEGAGGQADVVNKAGVLERIVGWSVSNGARIDRPPHEFAHHIIDMFPDMPHIKEGIAKFGSAEKFIQAVGEQYVKSLGANPIERELRVLSYKVRQAAAKKTADGTKFWSFVEHVFGSVEVQEIVSEGMLTGIDSNKGRKPTSETFLGNAMGDQVNTHARVRPTHTGADINSLRGNEGESEVEQVHEVIAGVILGKHLSEIVDAKAAEMEVTMFDEDGNFAPGFNSWIPLHSSLSSAIHNLGVRIGENAQDPFTGTESKWNPIAATKEQLELVQKYITVAEVQDTKGNSVSEEQMASGGGKEVTYNVKAVATVLAHQLLYPSSPIPSDIGTQTGITDNEKRIGLRLSKGLIYANQVAMSMETSKDLILTSDGKGTPAAPLAKAQRKRILENMNSIMLTNAGNQQGKRSKAPLLSAALDLLSDNARSTQAKIFSLDPTYDSPLYNIFVDQNNIALAKRSDVMQGRTGDKGLKIILEEAKSLLPDNVRYHPDPKIRGFAHELKDAQTYTDVNGDSWTLSVDEVVMTYMKMNYTDPVDQTNTRDQILTYGMQLGRARTPDGDTRFVFQPTAESLAAMESFVETYNGGILRDQVIPKLKSVSNRGLPYMNATHKHITGTDHPHAFEQDYVPSFFGGFHSEHKEADSKPIKSKGQFPFDNNLYLQNNDYKYVKILPAFEVYERLATDIANYHAHAIPAYNYRRFLNANVELTVKGERVPNLTFNQMIRQTPAGDYWGRLLQHHEGALNKSLLTGNRIHTDITGQPSAAAAENTITKTERAMYRLMIPAKLGVKLGTSVVQSVSAMFAMNQLNPIHVSRGMGEVHRYPRSWEEIKAWSPLIYERVTQGDIDASFKGAFDGGLRANKDQSTWESVLKGSMLGIRGFDAVAMVQIWGASRLATLADHPQLAEGSPEFFESVAGLAQRVVLEGQPTGDEFHKNELQNSQSAFRWAFVFGGQKVKLNDMMSMHTARVLHAKTPKEKADATSGWLKGAGLIALSSVAFLAIKKWLEYNEKEMKGELAYDPDKISQGRGELTSDEIRMIAYKKDIAYSLPAMMTSMYPLVSSFVGFGMNRVKRQEFWHEEGSTSTAKSLAYLADPFNIPTEELEKAAPAVVKGIDAAFDSEVDLTQKEWMKIILSSMDASTVGTGMPLSIGDMAEVMYRLKYPVMYKRTDDGKSSETFKEQDNPDQMPMSFYEGFMSRMDDAEVQDSSDARILREREFVLPQ